MYTTMKNKSLRIVVLIIISLFNVLGDSYSEPLSVQVVRGLAGTSYKLLSDNSDVNVSIIPSMGLIKKSLKIMQEINRRKNRITQNLKEIYTLHKNIVHTGNINKIAKKIECIKVNNVSETETLKAANKKFEIKLGSRILYILDEQDYSLEPEQQETYNTLNDNHKISNAYIKNNQYIKLKQTERIKYIKKKEEIGKFNQIIQEMGKKSV